jgi:hypothetical protein
MAIFCGGGWPAFNVIVTLASITPATWRAT